MKLILWSYDVAEWAGGSESYEFGNLKPVTRCQNDTRIISGCLIDLGNVPDQFLPSHILFSRMNVEPFNLIAMTLEV
ncbi:hypothetical protein D3C78_1710170 [compost metagenome]